VATVYENGQFSLVRVLGAVMQEVRSKAVRGSTNSMLSRLKSQVGVLLNRDPRISLRTYALLVRCPLFLPHDASYLGVRQIFDVWQPPMPPRDNARPLLLDIGANNGISSVGFLRLLPAFRVLAIEPNALHAPSLRRVAKRYPGRFEYRLAAAGADASPGKEIALFTPFWRSLALHTLTAARPEVVLNNVSNSWNIPLDQVSMVETRAPLITVDSLGVSPAIVKIDAEGCETDIIRGMCSTLDRCHPVLLMELTSLGAKEAVELTAGRGYRCFRYDESSGRLMTDSDQTVSHAVNERNRYFVPPDLCWSFS
jgi:FkbM family methyltransferase